MDNSEESLIAIQKLREDISDSVNAYLNYTNKVKTGGGLDEKQKSLIVLALSLQAKCFNEKLKSITSNLLKDYLYHVPHYRKYR